MADPILSGRILADAEAQDALKMPVVQMDKSAEANAPHTARFPDGWQATPDAKRARLIQMVDGLETSILDAREKERAHG